jgi:hypothetical protein
VRPSSRLGREISRLEQEQANLRSDLLAAITRATNESKSDYHEWRMAGFAIALAGSGVLAVANLA